MKKNKRTCFIQFRATQIERNWLYAQADLYADGNKSKLIWQRLYSGERAFIVRPENRRKKIREKKPKCKPRKRTK